MGLQICCSDVSPRGSASSSLGSNILEAAGLSDSISELSNTNQVTHPLCQALAFKNLTANSAVALSLSYLSMDFSSHRAEFGRLAVLGWAENLPEPLDGVTV